MSEFRKRLNAAGITARERVHKVFIIVTEETAKSVLDGSPLTNAAGQPVDKGNLYGSWHQEFLDEHHWKLATTGKAIDKETGESVVVGYAHLVEDNIRGVTFKNHGPHSVKDTRAGMDRIVEHAIERVKNGQ